MVKSPSNVGSRLQSFRKDYLNLTQQEFAGKVDTTQANVSQIEKGLTLPTGNYIEKLILNFPELDLNWLFYGTGEMIRGTQTSNDRLKAELLECENHLFKLEDRLKDVLNANHVLIETNNRLTKFLEGHDPKPF